jgi:hypothetical protein
MSKVTGEGAWTNDSWTTDTKKLLVMFRKVQKPCSYESKKQNRPVFKEVIHIVKIIPGDKTFQYDQPVTAKDKREFANEWAHWERTQENKIPGIPIEMWHQINDTQKAEFKAMKIQTVEQFAQLPDSIGQNIMGFHDLRRKAQAFIETGRDAEAMAQKNAEVDALKKEMADLRAMLEKVTAPTTAA